MPKLNTGVDVTHTCIPFQYETWQMRNLKDHNIEEVNGSYVMCLHCTNIGNMDRKARATRLSSLWTIVNHQELWEDSEDTVIFTKWRGSFPLDDMIGMRLAVEIPVKFLTARWHIKDHTQLNNAWKLPATFNKIYESLPDGVAKRSSFAKGTGCACPALCTS